MSRPEVAAVYFPSYHPDAHYEPIVTGNTPERFGRLVADGLASIRRSGGAPRMLLLNAWNEWTEGCYLLPDQRHGTGYLEALAGALNRSR